MTQFHLHQHGIFLVTTNARDREPWCVAGEIPEIILNTLFAAKTIYHARIFAFCILPDHFHVILDPGERGLSRFVQSFKSNSSRSIRRYFHYKRDEVSGELELSADVRSADKGVSADVRSADKCSVVSADPNTLSNPFEYHGIFHGWQHGFHAQRIAQEKIFKRSMQYVEANAKRHALAQHPRDWPWTSLHFGHVLDPVESFPFIKIP